MKRHDYLPFGEELIAPIGGRSTAQGYSGGDGVRQQFTSQERDTETQLDYYGTRFYSSIQGRFVSPDEAFADQEEDRPQSWNLYTYVRNNPLRYVDPYGDAHWEVDKDGVSAYVGDFRGEYDKDLDATWDGNNWNFHENNGQDNTVVAGAEPVAQDQSAQMASGAAIAFVVAPPPVKIGVVVGGAAGALIITGVVLFHEPVEIEVAPPPITYQRYVKPDKIDIGTAPPHLQFLGREMKGGSSEPRRDGQE